MMGFISDHGGLIGVVLLVIAVVNILLSAITSILHTLKAGEPGWLTTVASALSKVADWLSANVQHPPVK